MGVQVGPHIKINKYIEVYRQLGISDGSQELVTDLKV
jgi:hypothetical protein